MRLQASDDRLLGLTHQEAATGLTNGVAVAMRHSPGHLCDVDGVAAGATYTLPFDVVKDFAPIALIAAPSRSGG